MSQDKSNINLSDDELKRRLEGIEVPYDENSWHVLKDKYADFQTDKIIKEKVGGYEEPYDGQAWSMLSSKLAVIEGWKYRLINYKSIEFLLILLSFTLINVADKSGSILFDQDKEVTSIDQSSHEALSSVFSEGLISDFSEINETGNELSTIGDKSIVTSFDNEKAYDLQMPDGYEVQDEINSIGKEKIRDIAIKNRLEDSNHKNTADIEDVTAVNDNFVTNAEDITDREETYNVSSSPVDKLDGSYTLQQIPVISQIDCYLQDYHIPRHYNARKKNSSFWLGLALGYDRDLVRTPFPTQLSRLQLGRIESNFHAEIMLFWKLNYVEIQTGITFFHKSYRSAYEGVNDAMVVSIPANVRVMLSNKGFMKAYLIAGMSGHFVSHANYQETAYFLENPEDFYIENNIRLRDSKGLLSLSNFENGILEGESVRGNSFVTLNMGIGFNVPLSDQSDLFIEQLYFHHLSGGIGPAFDNISSFSTRIGARYLLSH